MAGSGGALPTTLITGFLGSGKTTLLNGLLAHPGMADTAVIINEFGEIGLDHLLVESAFEDAVLLKSGCICCTVRGDLVDTMSALLERRDRGEIPPFSRVAIETTGLADPAPILHTIMAEPRLQPLYRVDRVVDHGRCRQRAVPARRPLRGRQAGGARRPAGADQDRPGLARGARRRDGGGSRRSIRWRPCRSWCRAR